LDAKHYGVSGKGLNIQYSMLHVVFFNIYKKYAARSEGCFNWLESWGGCCTVHGRALK